MKNLIISDTVFRLQSASSFHNRLIENNMTQPKIPEYFSNKCVFVTGATGFLGKALVEKLLRTCTGIRKIYVLVRCKREKSGEERWKESTNDELFCRLKSERPGVLESGIVEVVEGDISEHRLGLSNEHYRVLQEEVSVVFHVAATVRFNEPLPKAIILNVRGTREIVHLALGMAKLEAFVHVSTAFCHCDREETPLEQFYPPPADWRQTIKIAETMDYRDLTYLENKILGKFPNTYTYTKNLAEDLIRDHLDRIPAVVVRPSVVNPAYEEPFQGWSDNLFGPLSLYLLACTGVMRVMLSPPNAYRDVIPVDNTVSGIIIAAWSKATGTIDDKEIPVYNLVNPNCNLSSKKNVEFGKRLFTFLPTKYMIWNYADNMIVEHELKFYILSIIYHIIPSILLDQLLKFFGQKPILSKTHKKLMYTQLRLKYFMYNSMDFTNEKYISMVKQLQPEDEDKFCIDGPKVCKSLEIYGENVWCYLKRKHLKDSGCHRKRAKVFSIVDSVLTYGSRGFLAWIAYKYIRDYCFEWSAIELI